MYIALDENMHRISADAADAADADGFFVCPMCKSKVLLCKGEVNTPYFRHKSLQDCDEWYDPNNMGEWHLKHQEQFPEECREVVIKHHWEDDDDDTYEIHRADVCIEFTEEDAQRYIDDCKRNVIEYKRNLNQRGLVFGRRVHIPYASPLLSTDIVPKKGIVIEFQHSPMSPSEFIERSEFYRAAGYVVYWIFDMRQKDITKSWFEGETGVIWKHPSHTFDYYDWTGYAVNPDASDWKASVVDVVVVFEMASGWLPSIHGHDNRFMMCKEFGIDSPEGYFVSSALKYINDFVPIGKYAVH